MPSIYGSLHHTNPTVRLFALRANVSLVVEEVMWNESGEEFYFGDPVIVVPLIPEMIKVLFKKFKIVPTDDSGLLGDQP